MRNKFTRSLALGMAFATAFTFTAPNASLFSNPVVAQAAVAKKAVKGTSKITASVKKATITAGKTKKVTVTLNKKQTKAVKVTLKSSKSSVAKVPASVTVKKNAKAASFKITGKKAGTATVTASFKTSANKTKKATIKVTVKAANVAVKGVSLSTTTPKVGDTVSAKLNPSDATNVVSYKWVLYDSADAETGVEAGTSASISVSATMKDKFLAVEVTDKDGNTFKSAKSSAIKEDVAANITINDASGLQTDGTGYINDVLELSYGLDFGTPASITWYRDNKILGTYNGQNGSFTNANGLRCPNTSLEGEYYVIAKSASGKEVTTNKITLTEKETAAVIKSFEILDDYETGKTSVTGAGSLTYAAADTTAVAKLVMNKPYAGNLRTYAAADTVFGNPVEAAVKNTGVRVASGTAQTAATAEFLEVTKANLTEERATAANATDAGDGIWYQADDGSITYMWVVGGTGVTRGTDYICTFDQLAIKTDSLGDGKENKSAKATAPYLKAPAKIAVTKRVAKAAPEVTVYDEAGAKLDWLGQATAIGGAAGADLGFADFQVYENTNSTTTGATSQSETLASTGQAGVITGDANLAGAGSYLYATLKTRAGIYGKDAVELKSDMSEAATPITTAAPVLKQKVGEATTAVVEFTNVKAPGVVYIIDDTNGASTGRSVAQIKVAAKGSAVVTKGLASVEVPGAIPAVDGYYAILVPDDQETYSRTDSAILNVTATITSYKLKTEAANGATGNGSYKVTDALTTLDQFGAVVSSATVPTADITMSRALSASASTVGVVTMKVTFSQGSTATDGDVNASFVTTGTAKIGDKWYAQIATGQYLVAECTTGGAAGSDVWKISIATTAP